MGKREMWLKDLKPGGSMLMHILIVQNVYSIGALTPYHSASLKVHRKVRKGQEEKRGSVEISVLKSHKKCMNDTEIEMAIKLHFRSKIFKRQKIITT